MAPPKTPSILQLTPLLDSPVRVSLTGGRLLVGTLRGYDELVNLVLDDTWESLRDLDEEGQGDMYARKGRERKLGLCVVRGTQVQVVGPVEGREEIENPFGDDDEEEEGN